jgi:signal transduction histidine kinase
VQGKLKLERRPVELREAVEQAVDGLRPVIQESRHRFEVQLPEAGLLVEGDPVRLAQVLLNLLLNAANYTHEGGEIRLIAPADERQVVLRVHDNGPGIPPELMEHLFDPFSQGQRDDRASPSGLGLGLGLTITRYYTQMHGGRLEARERSFAAGFDEHLAKPVELDTLQRLLDGLT